ncbi:hypothetical protein L1049_004811 [Liquidambar formosana]|uniref:Uncharacterized protein n=1 Tax=Liquidambar formosana TaxID=63359 RepID=A0AAP0X112_LIQFO
MCRHCCLCSRRSYAIAADNARVQSAATSVMGKAEESGNVRAVDGAAEQKEIFWVRDPKSGNWKPENHIGEIDVAELREKVLPKKERR